MMYWLSFYVEKRYPILKPRKWWQIWAKPEIEMQTGIERLSFRLTEDEAEFFISDSYSFSNLFRKFFPTAKCLQLEQGPAANAYVTTTSAAKETK
jgi:hypothetical protein